LARRTIQLGITQQLLAQKSACCIQPSVKKLQGSCGHIVCASCAMVRKECKCGQPTEWQEFMPTVLETAHKNVAYFILELEQEGKVTALPADDVVASPSSSSSSSVKKKKKKKKKEEEERRFVIFFLGRGESRGESGACGH